MEEEQRLIMIGFYSQNKTSSRMAETQHHINSILEIEPEKKKEVIKLSDYVLREVPKWQL